MSITSIEAKYGARVDVVPSDPSAFCLSVTDEYGTYANAFLTDEQVAQVAAALTGQEPEPAPFKEDARFEDIRVGDRVRRIVRGSDGSTATHEGVVSHDMSQAVLSADHISLAYQVDDADSSVTLTILSRPTPEWKPGDLALDTGDRVWRMDEEGDWWELGSDIYFYGTAALAESYGPLRRAKVVEADQ